MAAFIIVVVCLAIICWMLVMPRLQPRQIRRGGKRSSRASPPRNPWRATTIAHGSSACAAARAIEDERFLSGQAPRLPLPGCDAGKCHCRYVFLPDRRALEERRAMFGLNADLFAVNGRTERRAPRGRRKVDATGGTAAGLAYDDLKLGVG
ncbi:MAG: hypothetical protein H6987_08715 [Pseudomonadales bacterium]|nr:hypothetical protein [Halioglobus sp.]MCP5193132.1 hypothetical protein [Pseudomonadales bacterium]